MLRNALQSKSLLLKKEIFIKLELIKIIKHWISNIYKKYIIVKVYKKWNISKKCEIIAWIHIVIKMDENITTNIIRDKECVLF